MTPDPVDPVGANNQSDDSDQTKRLIYVPWYWDEMELKHNLRILGRFCLYGLGVVALFYFFGGWAFLGLIPIPFWYIYLLRQMDRDNYKLIEVRLEGDQKEGKLLSKDTQTNVYSIPPDIWKALKKEGSPFSAGDRIYICDRFDEEKGKIYFSHDKRFSNLNFWTRLELWMELKNRLPILEIKLAKYMYNVEQKSQDIALDILLEMGVFHRTGKDLEDIKRVRIIKESVPNAE